MYVRMYARACARYIEVKKQKSIKTAPETNGLRGVSAKRKSRVRYAANAPLTFFLAHGIGKARHGDEGKRQVAVLPPHACIEHTMRHR